MVTVLQSHHSNGMLYQQQQQGGQQYHHQGATAASPPVEWQLLYPELIALNELANLRRELPHDAYWQLQSAFVAKLVTRLRR